MTHKIKKSVLTGNYFPYLDSVIHSTFLNEELALLKSDTPHPDKKTVLEYLSSSDPFTLTFHVFDDPYTGEIIPIPPNDMTDGIWHWQANLSYYVEKYNVRLPEEFVANMRNNRWQCPDRSQSFYSVECNILSEKDIDTHIPDDYVFKYYDGPEEIIDSNTKMTVLVGNDYREFLKVKLREWISKGRDEIDKYFWGDVEKARLRL